MKLEIKQIIPVSNHWNVYMKEDVQEELYVPVSGLALIHANELYPEGESWQYIDPLHINYQIYPEAFENLTYMHTVFSIDNPNYR